MKPKPGLAVLAVVVLLGSAACEDIGSADTADVSISFAVPRAGTNAALVLDPISFGGHTLDVQNVDVTLGWIKLDRTNSSNTSVADGDSDSEGDSDEEEHIRFGPTTVSLPLQGGVITPITTAIPFGDYESIELKITSVRLRGVYDGQTFDVVLPFNFVLEQHFSPVFAVDSDADPLNITILVDPTLWLRNADGTLIDPRLLATDASLRAQVVNRIRSAFKAFEDADRDADDEDSDSDDDSD